MASNAAPRDELERRAGMSTLAHIAAGALLLAFSAGSLVSISSVAFYRFLDQWGAGTFDLPDAISLAVNLLLVASADVGMLLAASMLRNLGASGAPEEEMRVHRWAMVAACTLESSTYLYMLWIFDRPTTLFLWAIGIARALAAPLFAAYLSLARPLPVHARDVAYQASLHSGRGVVRDVARLAADQDAPLHHKVRIFTASARMGSADRAQFDQIIEAVSAPAEAGMSDHTATSPEATSGRSGSDTETPRKPPTGGGTPIARRSAHGRPQVPARRVIEMPSPDRRESAAQASARRSNGRGDRTRSRETDARRAWADGARTVGEMERLGRMSRSTATRWIATLKAEAGQLAQ